MEKCGDRKLRLGIIGCGFIAREKKLPSLSKLKNIEMVAFCDSNPDRAGECAANYGVEGAKIYSDYLKLIEDKSIDIVHVFTPNKSHSIISIDALKAGKHVMCEKPMAINAAEAKKMYEASKETGKKLCIGYQFRYRQDYRQLKEICDKGELGEIYFAKAYSVRRRAVPTWGVFLDKEQQGGGPLLDIGCHALDLVLWLMNNYEVKSVTGNVYNKLAYLNSPANLWGPWDSRKFEVEDSAFGFITMKSGATIIVETSWALNTLDVGEKEVTLCGTAGGASVKQNQILRVNGEKSGELFTNNYRKQSDEVESETDREARLWIDSILNNTDTLVKPEQALTVSEIIDAIYESSRKGQPVYFA